MSIRSSHQQRFIILGMFCAGVLAGAVSADTPPGALFDAPWIGYDTAVYPEGLWPAASDVGDFNADGAPDLAVVSWSGTPWLSILFGDGEGGYLPPVLYSIDLESLDVVARDFDNDGDIDLAIAETGRRWEGLFVSLWRNDGEGGFTRAGLFATGDDGPSGITAADFNGDGFMDVAVAHDDLITRDNTIAVLLNNQNGGFLSGNVITIPSGTNDLDSGDIDGDGDPDIVVAHENNFWSIVRNNGGAFQPAGTISGLVAGSIPENPVVTLGDVDLDGDLDVMFSNQDTGGVGQGAIGLWRNNGNGSFGAGERLSLLTPLDPRTSGGTDIDVADVTHDGSPDILVSNGYWFLIEGDGEGGFLPARLYHAGEGVVDIETTDLDSDGDLDLLALCRGSMDVCVYLNPGGGEFIQSPVIAMADPALAPAFPLNLRVDDVDDDGDLDFVTGYRSDFSDQYGLTLRLNNGDGTFGPIVEYLEPTYPLDLILRDMNGDGHEDLLYVLSTHRFYVRLNDGRGNFTTRLARHVFSGEVSQVDAVDVDNDGDLDVLVNAFFSVGISKNLGGNNYAAPIYHDLGGSFQTFGYGDFNNDGNIDLLTNSGVQGFPQISFGHGDGTFDSPLTVPTGRGIKAFASGDIDNDGNLDFASYYNLDEKGLGVRRGRGQGSFFLPFLAPGAYWFGDHTSTLDLVDLNANGDLDSITASFGGQDFSFWQGLGDGTFENDVRYGIGWHAYDVESGDFDGDGRLDVAAICRIDNGRWFYPAVVIIRGRDPGSGGGTPADLTTLTIIDGFLVSGGLPELASSDDTYFSTLALETGKASETHRLLYQVGATTTVQNPTTLDITLEGHILDIEATVTLLLKNFNTGLFEQVGQFTNVFGTDTTNTVNVPNASRFVDANGAIVLHVKKVIILPLTIGEGFPSLDDFLEIRVR